MHLGESEAETVEVAQLMMAQVPADEYPHLTEFTVGHILQPGYNYGDEFAFGLHLDPQRPRDLQRLGLTEPDPDTNVGKVLARLGRSWQGLPGGTMAAGKLGAEVLEPIPVSCAPSEFGNDAQSERVAANAGEMFTEQIGGSTDVAGGRGADHFNVMAFPAHRAATGGTLGVLR